MSKRRQNFQNISWFYDLYKRKLLDLDPPFQRRSVWNQTYREQFIDTILLDHPAPAIFLFGKIDESGSTTYQVVDGKQRLTTIFDFLDNQFPVSEASDVTSLRGSFFDNLSREQKVAFYEYDFSVEYLPTNEEQAINSIFDRLNRNVVKLTPQELRHAKFSGDFITSAEELSDWMQEKLGPFPQLSAAAKRQMKDVETVAILLLFLEEGAKTHTALTLDQAFSDRDTNWEARSTVTNEFREAIERLYMLFNASQHGAALRSSRLRFQADFYSLYAAYVELMRESHLPNDINLISERLLNFTSLVDSANDRENIRSVGAYYDATRYSSTDMKQRNKRIAIIKQVIQGVDIASITV